MGHDDVNRSAADVHSRRSLLSLLSFQPHQGHILPFTHGQREMSVPRATLLLISTSCAYLVHTIWYVISAMMRPQNALIWQKSSPTIHPSVNNVRIIINGFPCVFVKANSLLIEMHAKNTNTHHHTPTTFSPLTRFLRTLTPTANLTEIMCVAFVHAAIFRIRLIFCVC